MKRCIKRVIDWFAIFKADVSVPWKSIYGLIAILLGSSFSTYLFVKADTNPATASDYEPLEKQVSSISDNPSLLMETDCKINVNNKTITVTFENEECKIIAEYSKNFEVLSTSKVDKYMPWFAALMLVCFAGFLLSCGVSFVLTLLIFLLTAIVCGFYKRVKKLKAKFQKE